MQRMMKKMKKGGMAKMMRGMKRHDAARIPRQINRFMRSIKMLIDFPQKSVKISGF
ncbi:hypothetical protein ACNKHS_15910 [Shigella flexneri]